MTNEQINITIAEACNKVIVDKWGEKYPWNLIPDYCNDLNAMREAESVIFARELENSLIDCEVESVIFARELQNSWIDWLVKVVSGDGAHWSDYNCFPKHVRATSRQRAEVLLRTLEKWEGTK